MHNGSRVHALHTQGKSVGNPRRRGPRFPPESPRGIRYMERENGHTHKTTFRFGLSIALCGIDAEFDSEPIPQLLGPIRLLSNETWGHKFQHCAHCS